MGPMIAQLFITNKCNLSCPFCVVSIPKRRQEPSVFMTPEYVDRVLSTDIVKRVLVVILTGGEPLLNKYITAIIRVIKAHKIQCGMITNGLLFPEKCDELLNAGLDEIQISVYDHTLDRLAKLLPSVSEKMHLNASYVLLRSVLEKDPEHIVNVVRTCRDMGFSSFRFSLCQPYGDDTTETIFDDNDAYGLLKDKLGQENNDFELFIPTACKRNIRGRIDKKCFLPWQQIFIRHDGKIAMCCDFKVYTSERGTIFDPHHLSINNKDLRELRKSLLDDSSYLLEQCRHCHRLAGSFSSNL